MAINTAEKKGLRVKLTYDDYVLFPDDRNKHEIIEGEHFMVPSPNTRHQMISFAIAHLLRDFVHKKKLGKVLYAPIDVVLSAINVVQPDIIFISNSRSNIITEANIQGPPDLVIEIISESSRKIDKVLKKDLYAQYSVREYWIVDPVVDVVEIFILDEGGYKKRGEYGIGDTIDTDLIKGLTIPLNEVFEE